MAHPSASSVDRVLNEVTASWYEKDSGRFNSSKVPKILVDGQREQVGDTSFRLGALTNFVDREAEGQAWHVGDPIPAPRSLSENQVTVSPKGTALRPTSFPIPRNGGSRNRLEDARQAVPAQMSELLSRRDRALVEAMTTTATFGSNSWTGTQKFDEDDTAGDQNPIGDIEGLYNAFRFWRSSDLKPVCALDRLTLSVMAQKTAFHGAGAGSGAVARLTDVQMVQTLKDMFGFEDVWLFDMPGNAAHRGAADSVGYTKATPFFWMGLLDMRDVNLRSGGAYNGGGGALAIGEAIAPFVDISEPEGREVRLYTGKDEFAIVTPRFTAESIALGAVITGNFT